MELIWSTDVDQMLKEVDEQN